MGVILHGENMLIGSLIISIILFFYYIGIGSAVSNKIHCFKIYTVNISIYLFLGLGLSTIFESFYYRKFGGFYYERIQIISIILSLYGLYKIDRKKIIEFFVKNYAYMILTLLISYILMDNTVNMLTEGIYYRPFQELIFYKGANELVSYDFYNQFSGADTYFPVNTIIIAKIIATGFFNVLESGLLIRTFPIILFSMVMLSSMELLGINKYKKLILVILCAGQYDKYFLVNNNIAFYGSILLLCMAIYFYKNRIVSGGQILRMSGVLICTVLLYKSMFFLDLGALAVVLFSLIVIYYLSSTPIALITVLAIIVLQLHRASIAFILAATGIIALYIFLDKKNKNVL